MLLRISDEVRLKLQHKHAVTEQEILECFATRERSALIDDREDHLSDPATLWFISETFYGRKLLIAYIPREDAIHIRSAFEPSSAREVFYEAHSKILYPDFDDHTEGK